MQSIRQLISKDIANQASIYQFYNRELYKVLPPQLTGQCYVANITGQRIVITMSTSAVANQLRYLQNDVKKHFTNLLNRQISEITLKVSPKQLNTSNLSNRTTLSNQAASTIASTASSIKDEALKQSLKNLSKNTAIKR